MATVSGKQDSLQPSEVPEYDPTPYLAVLAKFRAEGLRLKRRADVLTLLLCFTLIAACALLGLITQTSHTWLLCVLMALGYLGGWALIRRASRQEVTLGGKLAWQVEHSGLANRLLRGEIAADPWFQHLPALERPLHRPLSPQDHLGHLKRVAHNIHWFLRPPRRPALSKMSMAVVAIPLAIGAVAAAFLVPALEAWQRPLLLLLGIGLTLLWPAFERLAGETVPLLADYLLGAFSPPVDAPASEILQDSTASLLLILNEVEDDLAQATRRTPLLVVPVMALLGLVLSLRAGLAAGLVPTDPSQARFLVAIAVFVVLILAGSLLERRIYQTIRSKMSLRVAAQLQQSDIASCIGDSRVTREELLVRVPFPLSLVQLWQRPPSGYRGSLRESIWEAAQNLDWYLTPSRKLIRLAWFALPAFIILDIPLVFVGGTLDNDILASASLVIASFVAVPCLLSMQKHNMQQSVWREELIRHLRERLLDESVRV